MTVSSIAIIVVAGLATASHAATFTVSTADDLAAAISAANTNGDASNTITLGANIDLSTLTPGVAGSTALPTLGATGSNKTLIINGGGNTLSGGGVTRIFFANTGDITIQNITLADGAANGGNGGSDARAGGGGMGAGGALFVRGDLDGHQAPNVTLANVHIVDNAAVGGSGGRWDGGSRSGGGGGMGGNGGANPATGLGGHGGGGAFPGMAGGVTSSNAGARGGGPDGGAGGPPGTDGGHGGEFSGGGGSGNSNARGGDGGFGGGGGGGGTGLFGSEGGQGGFGGGGGSAVNQAGAGGYGGGGASTSLGNPGAGGFGGGDGNSDETDDDGGGGAGMGGAIFVMEGGTLNIGGAFTVNGSTVAGGTSTRGNDGQGFGAGLFLHGSGTLTFNPATGYTQTIADNIEDEAGVIAGGYVAPAGFGPGGSWALNKTGDGTLVLSGINTYSGATTVSAGTLVVNGSNENSATTVESGATLMGSGVLGETRVNAGGIHAPGNSIGTQTVNGPYILRAGSILEIEANAAGQSDLVIVNGTVNITGATLRFLAEGGDYSVAIDYLIIDNDGVDAVTGTFGTVTSNLTFLAPIVSYAGGDGNDVVLTLARNAVSFSSIAATPNQAAVGTVLDQLPTADPLVNTILGQSADGARQAYDALSGEAHATLGSTLARDSRFVRGAIFSRLQQAHYAGGVSGGGGSWQTVALGNTGTTSVAGSFDAPMMGLGMGSGDGAARGAPPAASPLVFWTQAFGSWGEADGDGNAASADRTIGGFLSGVDTGLGGGWRAGAALGYSSSNVSVAQRISTAEIDSYHLAAYAGGPIGAFALRTGASWSWNDIDTERAVVFPGFLDRVEADYDGDTGQVFGEIALPLGAGALAYEPFASLAYVHVATDHFTEQGGLAALSGLAGEDDVGFSTLGVRLAWNTILGGVRVVPRASFAWQHAFGDVDPMRSLTLAGVPGMTISGTPLARDAALIEAGLDISLSPTATLGISYNGEIASGAEDHGVSGRLNWRF